MQGMKEQEQPKNAVPISLYPLKPSEAMRGLLAVKPQPKAKTQKNRKKSAKGKS
jgi:hypothetical protein